MGVTPEAICTLTSAKLLNENRLGKGAYSLKTLAHDVLGVPMAEIKKYEEVQYSWTSPEFIKYAQNDAIWTYQLWEKYGPLLHKQELEHLFFEVEMPFQVVLRDLEINGVKVDVDRLEKCKDEVQDILYGLESDMLSIFGKYHSCNINLFGDKEYTSPINFNSELRVIDLLESLGIEITERTKKGAKSLAKETKARIKGMHPFVDLYLRWCKLSTLYNNFILNATKFVDSDGRLRTSYGLKRTGRLSSSQPNLQNLPNPKKERLEFNHRELFIPEEGNVLVKADWSGQELRVLAEVSQDDNMIAAYNKNYDLHLYTANRAFDLNLADELFVDETPAHDAAAKKYALQRFQSKNGINFPVVYGAFPKRIAKENKVSIKMAEKWGNDFNALYPKVQKAKDRSKKFLKRHGYTKTLMGRKRRFPGYRSASPYEKAKMERQAFNMEIQGFSADAMKIAAAMTLPFLDKWDAKIVLTVHDELVFECPRERADKFAELVKYIMEHAVCISVPLPVSVEVVDNYGG